MTRRSHPFAIAFDIERLYYCVMKHCPRCRETKPFAEFHRNFKWKDGYQVYCKSCRKTYDHEYYERTHQRSNETRRERRRAHQRERNEWLRSLKMRPCADCGSSFAPEAMEWDHLPGEIKLGEISTALRHRSEQVILDEIAKCELVCANCHAIRTRARIMEKRSDRAVSEEGARYGDPLGQIPFSAVRSFESANVQFTIA